MSARSRALLPVLALLAGVGALAAPIATAATPQPAVSFPKDNLPAFGPAAVVSAHLLGAEPQTTVERPTAASVKGALNPNRVFVDWPLSSRAQTGTLHRSLDGGKTFRLIFDPLCSPRSRPMCTTGGGGDTENEVNPVTGQVYFGDQEVLAQEAFATSNDHGDTFPISQSFPVTAPATGVDRQWIAAVAPGIADVAGQPIAAFYTYHVPIAGEYVVGVTDKGIPIPQPAPQVTNVSQSGQVRVDNTNGPGRGWIYQPFRTSAYQVATASAKDYATPAGWKVTPVSKTATNPDIFPWLSLDEHGNVYAVWVHNGKMFYSYMLIDSKANNPKLGGRPGTEWSTEVEITPPGIGATIFPEIVAGSPGRVAIAFDGTPDFDTEGRKPTDDAPPNARWYSYVSVLTNALGQGGPVQVRTGRVSHRIIHTGNICTSGTTCAATVPEKDRSLLDLIDIGLDADGAVGVVYTDNNNAMSTPADPAGPRTSPFVQFAKQVRGTSIVAGKTLQKSVPTGSSLTDPTGDATWLNRADGKNLPSLDLKGVSVTLQGANVVARIPLSTGSVADMRTDFAAYNATNANVPPAARFQYIVRMTTNNPKVSKGLAGDVLHLSMEQTFASDGARRFFGGKVDANDAVSNPASPGARAGVVYAADAAVKVTGRVVGNTIELTAPASSLGLKKGTQLYGVAAFATVGPLEADSGFFTNISRTVDATAPIDLALLPAGAKQPAAAPRAPAVPAAPAGGSLPTTGGLGAPLAAAVLTAAGLGLAARRRRLAHR
jgi:hypothetical protein